MFQNHSYVHMDIYFSVLLTLIVFHKIPENFVIEKFQNCIQNKSI